MNNWRVASYIFFGVGFTILIVGLLESILINYGLNLNGSFSFSLITFLALFIPYLGVSSIFFVVAGVSFYASKPPPRLCSSCGQPIRFVVEYNRWYCDYEKKYVSLPPPLPP